MDYVEILKVEAENKAAEYSELLHEKAVLDMKIARTADYIKAMNEYLKAEGAETIEFNP